MRSSSGRGRRGARGARRGTRGAPAAAAAAAAAAEETGPLGLGELLRGFAEEVLLLGRYTPAILWGLAARWLRLLLGAAAPRALCPALPTIALAADAACARGPRRRYALVGHSQGGLAALSHALAAPPGEVTAVLCLCAPLAGTPAALAAAALFAPLCACPGPVPGALAMRPGSPLARALCGAPPRPGLRVEAWGAACDEFVGAGSQGPCLACAPRLGALRGAWHATGALCPAAVERVAALLALPGRRGGAPVLLVGGFGLGAPLMRDLLARARACLAASGRPQRQPALVVDADYTRDIPLPPVGTAPPAPPAPTRPPCPLRLPSEPREVAPSPAF
eukprot:m51a1_g11435 hypothetical protein (336) ;mRNA; r:13888-14895